MKAGNDDPGQQSKDGKPYIGLGIGIFRADARGRISSVVGPGDAAPGGGTFDYAVEPWINDGSDVSFILNPAVWDRIEGRSG